MRKTVLVTGGSSGIGAATALAFAQKGYDVAIACYNEDIRERDGEGVAASCREAGAQAECFVADVTDFAAGGKLIAAVTERFGGLDVLVNCAGITKDGLLARMSEESFDMVVNVNLKGTFNTIRHATPFMMKKHAGKIINIASVAGVYGNAGQANYSASKAGVIGLTKSVAKELGPRGITCNAIAPGFIETAMTGVLPESAREAILSATSLRRAGTAGEVAHAAVFLAENDFITGHVLMVDGGLSM